ncbi:co-chaperone GroES [Patescibacteria group bacterium]|nr:co-chaperone GroES [Patescibacteria group bacterium]MBU1674012.1 co-chaperone GroES [Patescibacteria group bacterium]MBU1963166.1 co-chaperone GroES [Patescibacteria group bacterium]
MALQPLGDRILVKPLSEEETTKSGIVLPDTVDKEKKAEGEILGIGDGEDIKKLGLKEGDKVLFGKYSGEDVEYEEDELKFLKYDEILAVVK